MKTIRNILIISSVAAIFTANATQTSLKNKLKASHLKSTTLAEIENALSPEQLVETESSKTSDVCCPDTICITGIRRPKDDDDDDYTTCNCGNCKCPAAGKIEILKNKFDKAGTYMISTDNSPTNYVNGLVGIGFARSTFKSGFKTTEVIDINQFISKRPNSYRFVSDFLPTDFSKSDDNRCDQGKVILALIRSGVTDPKEIDEYFRKVTTGVICGYPVCSAPNSKPQCLDVEITAAVIGQNTLQCPTDFFLTGWNNNNEPKKIIAHCCKFQWECNLPKPKAD